MYEHIFYERRLDHVSILLRSGCAVAYMALDEERRAFERLGKRLEGPKRARAQRGLQLKSSTRASELLTTKKRKETTNGGGEAGGSIQHMSRLPPESFYGGSFTVKRLRGVFLPVHVQ